MTSRAQLDLQIQMKGADKAAADINKLATSTDKLDKNFKGISSGLGGFGGALGSLPGPLGIAGAGIAALGAGLVMAAKAAAEEQVGIDRMNQALKNAVPGFNAATAGVEKYVSKMEKLAFADDEIRDSLTHLVTQTGDLAEAQKLQATAMDLARAKGIDLATATKAVGKVDQESIGILKKLGIQVTDQMGKEEALTAIRKATAGQAEAYAKTTAGSMERIQNTFGNIVEDIGGKVLGLIEGPLAGIADFLQSEEFQGIADFVLNVLGAAFTVFGNVVGTVFKAVMTVLGPVFEFLKGAAGFLGGIWDFISGPFKSDAEQVPTIVGDAATGAADNAKAAADRIGTEFPAGFKAGVDGAVTEIERIPTATELAIQAATSKWAEIDMGGKLKFVVTPSAVIQPIPQDELDRHATYIAGLIESGMGPIQIQKAVETQVQFSQVAVPPDQQDWLNTRIEELIQGGVGAQQALIIVQREIQLKANVNQDLADAENSRRQAQTALDGGLGGTANTYAVPVNAEINVLATLGQSSVQSLLAVAEYCKPIFTTEVQKPFPVQINPTPLLGPTVLPAAQTAGVAIPTAVMAGVVAATQTATTASQNMGTACLTALEKALPAITIHGYGERVPSQTAAGVIAQTPLAKSATDNLTAKVKTSMDTGLAGGQFHLLGVAIPTMTAGGINQAAPTATSAASTLAGNVKTNVATADDNAFSTGQAVGTGLANGIGSMFQRVYNAAWALAQSAKNAAKAALEEDSPSKVFYRIGDDIVVGLAYGITENAHKAMAATVAMVDQKIIGAAKNRLKNLPEDDLREIAEAGTKAAHAWGYGFDPGFIDLCAPVAAATSDAMGCFGGDGASAAQAWADGFNDRMASGIVTVGQTVSGPGVPLSGGQWGGGHRPVTPMASGGSFWTNGPTPLLVGEAGREFVSVTPQGKMGAGGPLIGTLNVYAGLGANGRQIANDLLDELSIRLQQKISLSTGGGGGRIYG